MSHKILIIEDDAQFLELLQLRLGSILGKVHYVICTNIQEAKEQANKEDDYSLVIVDENLPDGLGSDLIKTGVFVNSAVLSMSSDESPQATANTIKSGATFFLSKKDLSAALFEHLVHGLIQRNLLAKALVKANHKLTVLDTVRKLISTLKHEINNPLAAIIGSLFLLKKADSLSAEQQEALSLVENSAERIKEVIEKLELADDVETTTKSNQKLFKIPGDDEWEN